MSGSGRHGIRTCSKEGLFEVLGRESFLVGKEVFPSVPVKSFIRTFQKGEKGIGHQSRDYRDGFFRQVSFGGAETAESGGSGGDRLKPQERAEQVAKEFGIPKAYGDARQLIHDPEVEAVHNCTPNHLHFPLNREVLEAGKHLLSEKLWR